VSRPISRWLDDGLVVFKDIFNRVFERDDVLFEIGIDVLDHRGERRGFAGTVEPATITNAARRFGERLDLLQQAELLEAWHGRLTWRIASAHEPRC